MSMSEGSLDLSEAGIVRSFPIHKEIALPNTDITLDSSVTSSNRTSRFKGGPDTGVYSLSHGASEEMSHYDQIDIQIDTASNTPGVTDQKSVYALKSDEAKRMLAKKSREVSTRQSKFEIGEEWETFQTVRKQSARCPSMPLAERQQLESLAVDNPAYAASEPENTDDQKKTKEPIPFHFLFSAPPCRTKEHHVVPNPYNKLNQRFHSTLQCPCFLFFFFLCCLPAVHYMQWSDHQYKKGNNYRARRYGKISTVLYIVGTIVGVAFLSVCIYFAADYVRQFVSSS